MKKENCTAIILAAGQGKRMDSKVPKLYLEMQGKPILYYTLQTFTNSQYIDSIILVVGLGQVEQVRCDIVERYSFSKVTDIIEGGHERYDSVWCGLQQVGNEKDSYVFIHDGARAFVTEDIICRAYENVCKYKACIVGMPVKDTIKIVDDKQVIRETPDRSNIWQAQTPQAFETPIIVEAYSKLMNDRDSMQTTAVTDDSILVERLGKYAVKLVKGSYDNIKITTPEDIVIAEQILKEK